jgi:hypothetical protein
MVAEKIERGIRLIKESESRITDLGLDIATINEWEADQLVKNIDYDHRALHILKILVRGDGYYPVGH